MYNALSLLTGVLVAVMIIVNGGLSDVYGLYGSSFIIHATGLVCAAAAILLKRENPFRARKWYLYLGGVIGVLTILFNNLAFVRVNVSAILALGLFGQCAAGAVIDHFGLFGTPRHAFRRGKLAGFLLLLCGIVPMIETFNIFAILICLLTGLTVILSRTVNAKLAEATNSRISTFWNYVTGTAVTAALCLLLGRNEPFFTDFTLYPQIYIYTGGAIGLCTVWMCNVITLKLSAFYFSLFLFIGQVFSGILIDALISQAFSPLNLIGGLFAAAGLFVSLYVDKKSTPSN